MATSVDSALSNHVLQRSILRLKELLEQGDFDSYAAVDPQTGRLLNPEAQALFATLPTITPASHPQEVLERGLVSSLPQGLRTAKGIPAYRQGRSVFVKTKVTSRPATPRVPVGTYDPQCSERVTHLATLVGRKGEDFWVKVEGHGEPLMFSREHILRWNQPCAVASTGGHLSGVHIDYRAPRLKAYVCAAYLSLGDMIGALDFRATTRQIEQQQKKILASLGDWIGMSYPGHRDGYQGNRAASLIGGGLGVSFVQRAVAAGFLQAFYPVLNFEIQAAVGKTLRLGAVHAFLVVTLRPSMTRFVCDPAWQEPLTPLNIAFFGPQWGHDRCVEHLEGEQDLDLDDSEIELGELESED
jgi:hypothetical protein